MELRIQLDGFELEESAMEKVWWTLWEAGVSGLLPVLSSNVRDTNTRHLLAGVIVVSEYPSSVAFRQPCQLQSGLEDIDVMQCQEETSPKNPKCGLKPSKI